MKYRVKFTKTGNVRFLGHLDVMRYFQKAIRRAALPVAYSEGFSPHQIISFASPLSVGAESVGEYFDVEMKEAVDPEALTDRLNAVMAEGFSVTLAVQLPETAGHKLNAMAQVRAAEYMTAVTDSNYVNKLMLTKMVNINTLHSFMTDSVDQFMKKDDIPFVKHTKKSDTTINLKDSLYRLETIKNNCNLITLSMLVCSSSSGTGNLKPREVVSELFHFMEQDPPEELRILRLETYGEKDGRLVPLWEAAD